VCGFHLEGVATNIVIVSVLLFIATVILVAIGFVFGGPLWGLLLAEFIFLLILAGLYVAEEQSENAAIMREQIAARNAARARERPLTEVMREEPERER
jgi:type III secretory pathway component EscV